MTTWKRRQLTKEENKTYKKIKYKKQNKYNEED